MPWLRSLWKYNGFIPDPDFPTNEEIIFAAYEGGSYEGDALVLFERGGQLYEAHGYHCSCYGLEGQWAPEATTWEALAIQKNTEGYTYGLSADSYAVSTRQAFKELIERHQSTDKEKD